MRISHYEENRIKRYNELKNSICEVNNKMEYSLTDKNAWSLYLSAMNKPMSKYVNGRFDDLAFSAGISPYDDQISRIYGTKFNASIIYIKNLRMIACRYTQYETYENLHKLIRNSKPCVIVSLHIDKYSEDFMSNFKGEKSSENEFYKKWVYLLDGNVVNRLIMKTWGDTDVSI